MTDPLERLRRANPVPAGLPAPPIEPVLRLLDAEPAVYRAPSQRRVAGRAMVVLGAAVAVAVAALAVILVGRAPIPRSTHPPAATTVGIPAGLNRLRADFAVLRRPQTPADRAFAPPPAFPVISSLTRFATTLPNGELVYLTIHRLAIGSRTEYALDTWVKSRRGVDRPGQYVSGTPLDVTPWEGASEPRFVTWVSVVPDAVESVEWTFRGGYHALAFARNNVVAIRLRAAVAPGTPAVRWFGEGRRPLIVASTKTPSTPPNGPLAGNGVAGVRFGSKHREAVAQLDTKLSSRPTQRYHTMYALCNIDASAAWGSLSVYFWHGRFVGYQYGSFKGRLHPVLTGPAGLHVGETLAEATHQFGRVFRHSFAQGGSWSLKTSHGTLIGYASQPQGGTIVTIDAGSVGCPALTP